MRKYIFAVLMTALAANATTSAPAITSGGVVSSASYAAGVAPTSWITIFGTNLATTTVTATSSDLVNGYLPTTLGGTSVTIGGQAAYMDYVSPTQVNVEAPASSATGTVSVVLTTSAGSVTTTATISSIQPGLFMLGTYAAAVRPSDSTIINGTGAAISGYATSASANPGDVLELYATGMGTTATALAAGLVFTGSYPTTYTPTVTIGGATAAVSYCGMTEAGLYQINITVPTSLTAGTYSVVVTQDGIASPASAQLTIAPSGGTGPGGGGGTGPGGGTTTTTVTGMTIGSYSLLSSYNSSSNEYYYTYTTSVTNTNSSPYTYVLGTLTSSSANTVVVSGSVEFGLVPAKGTANGFTTFTILQNTQSTFDPTSLSWTFTGQSSSSTVGTTQSTVTVSVPTSSITYGTSASLAAVVSPATATGTVTFYDGPLPVGTATLSNGTATLSGVVLPTGAHDISALYGGDTTYAAGSSSPAAVTVGSGGAVANCSGLQDTALVVCLANAFEATLTSSQLATAQLSYTLANVEVWSNLPNPARNGLEFSSLTSTQLAAALQLAQAALSSEGYTRLYNIVGANNILGQYTNGYGAGFYYIAILGTPSTSSTWQLQIGGHHYALNHTYNGTYTSGTPYFIGNEPEIYTIAGTQYLPTQGPHDAAYALMRSLYGNSTALLSGTFDDVLMGSSGVDPYPRTYPTSGRGILYSALTTAQQAQVKAMIEAWVNDMDSTTSSSLLSVYEDPTALASTYVGYSGDGTLTTQGDYIRIDGPRVWIEFCVQNGIVFTQSYHFHTVWRDKTADYGGDFLSQ